ncbi:MAG TPA: type II secretion system protein [Candidatus Methylacidiphilales bacterium]
MRSIRKRERGIILLEVMLAVAIFCIVGVALAKSASMAAEALAQANRVAAIRQGLEAELAQALIDPLVVGAQPSPIARTVDDGVTYEREWKPLTVTSSDKIVLTDLYTLTVRARWTENGKEAVQEETIRVYHPQS